MIGRNDLCICGSGKKYKKCCEGKQQPTIESVLDTEIENILQTFYSVYPERQDIKQYIELVQSWTPTLEQTLQRELIEAVVLDEFFFHQRPDIWTSYLKRQQKKILRPTLKNLLTLWAQPTIFIGQIERIEEKYAVAKHALTDEEIYIRRESHKPIPEKMYVFAFLIREQLEDAKKMIAISTLIFFPLQHEAVFNKLKKSFSSFDGTAEIFLQQHHLSFWEQLVAGGYAGEEFTSFESEVIEQTKSFLTTHGIEHDKLIDILQDYLVEQQPAARKAVAIAAGAIRYGQERKLFGDKTFTVKEIAEHFGVSASSLNKYYQELNAYTQATV